MFEESLGVGQPLKVMYKRRSKKGNRRTFIIQSGHFGRFRPKSGHFCPSPHYEWHGMAWGLLNGIDGMRFGMA